MAIPGDAVLTHPWRKTLGWPAIRLIASLAAISCPAAAEEWHGIVASPVQVHNGSSPGSLVVRATRPTALAPDLIVERQLPDKGFAVVRNLDLDSLHLLRSCGQSVRTCIEIGTNGLSPVPWTGMSCSSQCQRTCDKNERLHGHFRFVVLSCDRKTRYAGSTFFLP